jgi:4-hydroxy-2-oxoheptanedioate aldolase
MDPTKRRALKAKLARRALVQGVKADFPSDDLVACLAPLGFDLIFIDCEHGGPDFETVVRMTRAARAGDAVTVLRPWSTEPGLLRRFIDSGIDGLVAPGVQSADELRRITQIIATNEPLDPESFLLVPLIENRQAVEDLDAILAVPGVDGLLIGTHDLAVSLGEPLRGDAPRARAMTFQVLDRARALGRSAGLPAARYGAEAAVDGGANVLMWTTQQLLKACAQSNIKLIEEHFRGA